MRKTMYQRQLGERLVDALDKALARKPRSDARLAGCLRAAAPHSRAVRHALVDAAERLVARRAFRRPLYAASIRSLAELDERSALEPVGEALKSEAGGGLDTLSAATHLSSARLGEPLARAAANRHPEIAFAAELVRKLRAEGGREALRASAARVNDKARIALATRMVWPLVWRAEGRQALPATVGPAMGVLRDAERHLGRWLVFATAEMRGGGRQPLLEARKRARLGHQSSRTAWTLLAWGLSPEGSLPPLKATSEIVARLSERPIAERDLSFLFRMAEAGVEAAFPLMDTLSRAPLRTPQAVRAAAVVARAGNRGALAELGRLAESRRSRLRGIAVAALWDAGCCGEARQRAEELLEANHVVCAVWGALVMQSPSRVIDERNFRLLERGWLE